MVGAIGCTEACMRFRCDGTYPIDGNVGWEQAVQPIGQGMAIYVLFTVEVCYHQACMYAGICSPCTCYIHFAPLQCLKGMHQFFLYTDPVGLYLPTVVPGTIVS